MTATKKTARTATAKPRKPAAKKPSTAKKATTKKTPAKKPAVKKPATPATTKPAPKTKRIGLLDAAAQILAKAKEPMGCKEIVEQVFAKTTWTTTGKTPWATLSSAMLREIQKKGKAARFEKTGPGKFRLRKGAAK